MIYLTRIPLADLPSLVALLQTHVNGSQRLPWSDLVRVDLSVLYHALPDIFSNVPPPYIDVAPYWQIIGEFPNMWREIVMRYSTPRDDVVSCLKQSGSGLTNVFKCDLCAGASFETGKALAQHKRMKHCVKSTVCSSLPDTSVCPICHADFRCRSRLISHLSDKRIRSKTRGTNCYYLFLNNTRVAPSEDEQRRLQNAHQKAIRTARLNGHTHVLADLPAQRSATCILKGIKRKQRAASCLPGVCKRRLTFKQSPPLAYCAERLAE